MTAIYEFTAYLRIPAESEAEARRLAREFADVVSQGDVSLALDDSDPSVEVEEDPEP